MGIVSYRIVSYRIVCESEQSNLFDTESSKRFIKIVYSYNLQNLPATSFNPNNAGFFNGSFFCRGGGQFEPRFIFQEELIKYQYDFIQLLNNLFKVF